MAAIMQREFGSQLVKPGELTTANGTLPTLHQLRRRILLKGKRPTSLDSLWDDRDVCEEEEEQTVTDNTMISEEQLVELARIRANKRAASEKSVATVHKDLCDILCLAGINAKKLKSKDWNTPLPPDVMLSTNETDVFESLGNEASVQSTLVRNRHTLRLVIACHWCLNNSVVTLGRASLVEYTPRRCG